MRPEKLHAASANGVRPPAPAAPAAPAAPSASESRGKLPRTVTAVPPVSGPASGVNEAGSTSVYSVNRTALASEKVVPSIETESGTTCAESVSASTSGSDPTSGRAAGVTHSRSRGARRSTPVSVLRHTSSENASSAAYEASASALGEASVAGTTFEPNRHLCTSPKPKSSPVIRMRVPPTRGPAIGVALEMRTCRGAVSKSTGSLHSDRPWALMAHSM